MDNVSIHKCSQKFTWKAALKFEGAVMGTSSITNSAIHHGKGIGVHIVNSQNIVFDNNVVTDFAEHGIWVQGSNEISMDNNWLFHVIQEMDTRVKMFEYFGWKGGFTLSESNRAMSITNNVVAGTWHHGFHFVPKKCDDNSPDFVFEGNVAHSISGYGAIAKNVMNSCTEVHDFIAYKVTEASIMLGGASKINRGRDLIAIDTRYSIGVVSGASGDAEIIDSKVYGELQDNMDCP